jgi:drug/metabolite transporter (DMT)-like permease
MKWALPLSILILFEAVADVFAENWAIKGGLIVAIVAILSYCIGNIFWLFALRNGAGLGKGALIFSVVSAFFAILIGIFLYKEPVSRIQAVGMFLGLISLVLIFWR